MKKINALLLGLAAVVLLASCSKEAFSSKYYDPSKTTSTSCEKVMTGAFMAGNGFTFNAYWRMYTWDNYFGKLAQTIGVSVNSGSNYFINDGYANDRWNSFYDILRQYRVLKNLYDLEEAEDQAQDRIFVALTEVYLYDHLSQIVDIFGPVPFENAGFLGITGDLEASYPSYDSDVDLYKMMLTNLDALYTEIGTLKGQLTQGTEGKLKKQDYICGGDLDKWQAYANSLLLRLGVHMSAKGSLVSEGKAAVAKAAGRSLITTWDESVVMVPDFNGFNYWENFRDGYKDINNTASQGIIDALQVTGKNDPRLEIIYFPNEEGAYYGKHYGETRDEQDEHDTYNDYTERYYARLNAATFTYNNLFLSPVITGAEVNFLLAEAYQQGYASGNAEAAFKKAIVESCHQYYDLNLKTDQSKSGVPAGSQYFKKLEATDVLPDADLEALAADIWNAYSDKMEGIMTQKWAHFGIVQATQAWTDIRRTGYPKLDYPTDNGAGATVKNIVNRVKYPNTEANNNKANYEANKANVGGDDNAFTLFWATTLK